MRIRGCAGALERRLLNLGGFARWVVHLVQPRRSKINGFGRQLLSADQVKPSHVASKAKRLDPPRLSPA
jgi:hypothetical protein